MRISTLIPAAFSLLTVAHALPGQPDQKNPEIVGGTLANITDYPFMGALRMKNDADGFFCGGTLITQTRVLSAAHCLADGDPASSIEVRFGSNDQTEGGTVIDVAAYKIHPEYNSTSFANDVAILELTKPAPKSLYCATLPKENSTLTAGTTLKIVGWGAAKTGGGAQRFLRKAQIHDLPDKLCAKSYPAYHPPQMICAGERNGSRDTCQGDSGGPLLEGNRTVVGVVSFGNECGSDVDPGVYTSVSHYLPFIRSAIVS